MKKWNSIILLVLLVLIDQVTKFWAKFSLEGKEPIVILKNIFCFQYLEGGNTGAAFGIFQGNVVFLSIVSFLVFLLLLFVIFRIPNERKYLFLQISVDVLAAGAMGNLIDRVIHNYVIDFIYFNLIDFPIFNVADCYVVISAVALIFLFAFYYKDNDLNFLFKKGKLNN